MRQRFTTSIGHCSHSARCGLLRCQSQLAPRTTCASGRGSAGRRRARAGRRCRGVGLRGRWSWRAPVDVAKPICRRPRGATVAGLPGTRRVAWGRTAGRGTNGSGGRAARRPWLECADARRLPRQLCERYLPWRRPVEVGFWVVGYPVRRPPSTASTVLMDVQRAAPGLRALAAGGLGVEQRPGAAGAGAGGVAFDAPLPAALRHLRRNLRWHLLASVVFSVLHVLAMVGLRKRSTPRMGDSYDFGPWPRELVYEYLKDVRTYAGILVTLSSCTACCCCACRARRACWMRPTKAPPVRDRSSAPSASWCASSARSSWSPPTTSSGCRPRATTSTCTCAAATTRCARRWRRSSRSSIPARFVRVHRSYMVNLDCLAEIEPLESATRACSCATARDALQPALPARAAGAGWGANLNAVHPALAHH